MMDDMYEPRYEPLPAPWRTPITVERDFYNRLLCRVEMVQFYEDPTAQAMACSCVPSEELREKALKRSSSKVSSVEERDLFLLELLHWFKFDFFKWVDQPECPMCSIKTEFLRLVDSTVQENNHLVDRVELYRCYSCNIDVRFPRYNDPKILLQTRKGRCGEWANCFTFVCRAMGFEARLIFDWNDHVWTEVYSEAQERWLHCDSCENLCDSPLVYETGWKKNIAYVLAFSKDEIQDVTWRYSSDFAPVMRRRRLCKEQTLLQYIADLTFRLQQDLPKKRRDELTLRKLRELAEFLTPAKVKKNGETQGRMSGCLAWREARGEYQPDILFAYTFGLLPEEVKKRFFHIQYNCAKDTYCRVSQFSSKITGWRALAYDAQNVFRKVENDWKVAYISRKENMSFGRITWKFDFHKRGLAIESVQVKVSAATFENGVVRWTVDSGDLSVPIIDMGNFVHVNELRGFLEFSITAEFTAGIGDVAWQHAQILRQSLESTEYNFEVIAKFYPV